MMKHEDLKLFVLGMARAKPLNLYPGDAALKAAKELEMEGKVTLVYKRPLSKWYPDEYWTVYAK